MLETDTSSGLEQLMRLRVTIAKVISATDLLIYKNCSQTVAMLSRTMAEMESASIAQCVCWVHGMFPFHRVENV